jgi:hypothetical protein
VPTIAIPKFKLFGHLIWSRHELIAPLNEVFPAIWNLADFAITSGIVLIFVRQRAYFPKDKITNNPETSIHDSVNFEELTAEIKKEKESID